MARAPLGILVLLLAGCSSQSFDGFPDRALDSATRVDQLETVVTKEQVEAYHATDDPVVKRRLRNDIVNAHAALIDINFTEYLKDLHRVGVGLNLGTSAATIGLGAAGALVSGGTSQILSGTSAAVTGFKESVDKEAFFEQTMPALVTKMIAERQKVLVTIRRGLSRDVEEYPLTQGLGDIESYYYAGTIPGALAGVANDAGADLEEARQDLRDLSSPFVRTPAGDLLRDFWRPDGDTIDQSNQAEIRRWLDEHGLAGLPSISSFIRMERFEAQREQAVRDLGLPR